MKRNFSLIELIVSIVVMGILLSIVIINILDNKKEAIKVSVLSNTKLIQNAVDSHFLKEMEDYPTIGNLKPTLNNPQLIDVEILVKEGLLKKDLDLSKIKTQYYWLDVFGKVWGATNKDIHSINLYSLDAENSLEFVLGKKVKGYKLYETLGYGETSLENLTASSVKDVEKLYKEVGEVEISNHSNGNLIKIDLPNKESNYLVSILDEYGLETAPFGKFSSNFSNGFKPLLNKTGIYEFEINSAELMYWISYQYVIDTPGESTITFDFKIANEDGTFQDWNGDFYSLDPSTAIVARVDMKGDSEGNKPSLFDFRIDFEYEHKLDPITPPSLEVAEPSGKICPEATISSDFSRLSVSKGSGLMVYSFYVKEGVFFTNDLAPKIDFAANLSYKINKINYYVSLDGNSYESLSGDTPVTDKCMLVVYDITILEVPPSEAINKVCEQTKSCYVDYCKELGNCPVPSSCETTNSCSNNSCEGSNCSSKSCIELNNCSKPTQPLCGTGATKSSSSGSNPIRVVYSYLLGEDQSISKLDIKNSFEGYVLKNIYIEYSADKEPFEKVKSFSDIPKGSCFNVVYELTKILGYCSDCYFVSPIPNPPTVEVCKDSCPTICKVNCTPQLTGEGTTNVSLPSWCDYNDCSQKPTCIAYQNECVPPVCETNCKTEPPMKPNPKDTVLLDKEWTTVDNVRFFAHGSLGQMTRWYKAEHIDSLTPNYSVNEISQGENVRIIYRYSKSVKLFWSDEYVDFATTGVAQSVLGIAYIQVKTDKMKEISEDKYPTVQKIRFHNEQGYLDVSMVQPTLTIIPVKDNNKGREVFSDESNIEWTYMAADPRNKKIVDIEWDGDIRSKYPIGTYEVKARVKNEVEIWSEWVTFKFTVLQEKPIAILDYKLESNGRYSKYIWNINNSKDPDGDAITSYEVDNLKETYSLGHQVVKARVKDKEGYWSDWVQVELNVVDQGLKVYRLEAEIADLQVQHATNYIYLETSDSYSNSKGIAMNQGHSIYHLVTFTFEGTGFDYYSSSYTQYSLDGGPFKVSPSGLTSVRSLEYKKHTVVLSRLYNYGSIDYLDVFSIDDTVSVSPVKITPVLKGVDISVGSKIFSTNIGQEIKFNYQVDKDSNEKVTIVDSNGKLIRNISHKDIKGGSYRNYEVIWDGKDNVGKVVKNGVYTILLEYKGIDGSKSNYKQEVEILNETPIYRLEAEIADSQVTHATNYIYSETVNTYSNGKGIAMNQGHSIYHLVTFTFEGNGFDYYSSSYTQYSLDGGPSKVMPAGLTSVRSLESKKHTVVVSRVYNYGSIDYLDVYSSNSKVSVNPVKITPISKGVEVFVGSNIFSTNIGEEIKFNYQVDKDSNEKVTIVDSNGKLIRNISHKDLKGGSYRNYEVVWDGKDNNGNIVKNGMYDIFLEYQGIDGSKSNYRKTVQLLNETPVYRLEAEIADSQVTHATNYIYSETSSDYSNGKGIAMNQGHSIYHLVTFTFEGDGFQYYSKTRTQYSLDGASSKVVPAGFVSVRSLENKKHTVVVSRVDNYGSIDYLEVFSSQDIVSITPTKITPVLKGQEILSGSNIFSTNIGQEIKFNYQINKDSNEKITIIDSKGQLIRNISQKDIKGGSLRNHSVSWDGKDNKGNVVDNGNYSFKLEYTGIYGSKAEFKQEIKLLNETPNYRLEAEITNGQVKHGSHSAYISDVAGFSGGRGVTMSANNSMYHMATFTFEGTGFDYYANNPTKYSLDGGPMQYSPTGLISLRMLDNKKHTVEIHRHTSITTSLDYLDVY